MLAFHPDEAQRRMVNFLFNCFITMLLAGIKFSRPVSGDVDAPHLPPAQQPRSSAATGSDGIDWQRAAKKAAKKDRKAAKKAKKKAKKARKRSRRSLSAPIESSSDDDDSDGPAAASSVTMGDRMSWMVTAPARPAQAAAPANANAELVAAKAATLAAADLAEVEAGTRSKDSNLLFGLHDPKVNPFRANVSANASAPYEAPKKRTLDPFTDKSIINRFAQKVTAAIDGIGESDLERGERATKYGPPAKKARGAGTSGSVLGDALRERLARPSASMSGRGGRGRGGRGGRGGARQPLRKLPGGRVGDGGSAWARKAAMRAHQRGQGGSTEALPFRKREDTTGDLGTGAVAARVVPRGGVAASSKVLAGSRGGGKKGKRGAALPRQQKQRAEKSAAPRTKTKSKSKATVTAKAKRPPTAEETAADAKRREFLYGGARKPAATAAASAVGLQPLDPPLPVSMSKNQLAAALMKAQLTGDAPRVAAIKARMAAASTSSSASAAPSAGRGGGAEAAATAASNGVQLVAPLSMSGARMLSLLPNSSSSTGHSGANPGFAPTSEDMRERQDKRGKRKRSSILASRPDAPNALGAVDGSTDGSGLTIREMMEMERSGGRQSMDEIIARNIVAAGSRYKDARLGSSGGASRAGADEEEQMNMALLTSKRERATATRRKEIDMQEAVRAEQRFERAQVRDRFAVGSPAFAQHTKHLVLAMGEYCYLMLHPNPLAPGHCMIVPNERVWGMSEAGEEVHAEFGKWCGALRRMFYSTGAGVVMMETVMGGTSPARKMMAHTKIDVIPVAPRVVGDCPLFFKKALLECDDQWAANNQKVIDVAAKGGLRRAVPPTFPYFHVNWAAEGTYLLTYLLTCVILPCLLTYLLTYFATQDPRPAATRTSLQMSKYSQHRLVSTSFLESSARALLGSGGTASQIDVRRRRRSSQSFRNAKLRMRKSILWRTCTKPFSLYVSAFICSFQHYSLI